MVLSEKRWKKCMQEDKNDESGWVFVEQAQQMALGSMAAGHRHLSLFAFTAPRLPSTPW